MKVGLRILGFVVLTILTLSITINDKPIFSHIYGVISPATRLAQKTTGEAIEYTVDGLKKITKKLFDNSNPSTDSLKSKMAGIQKKGDPEEIIETHEKEKLDDLIKSYK